MIENQVNKKHKIVYIIIPVLIVISVVGLILLLNTNNHELKSNSNSEIKTNEPNYDEEVALGDILFNSNQVAYSGSSSGISANTVKNAIDELYYAINNGCQVGYTKGIVTQTSYVCDKRSTPSNVTTIFDSMNVKYDNSSSGLTSTNVKATIDELASHVSDCAGGYHKDNTTSSSYNCLVNSFIITLNEQNPTTHGTTSIYEMYGVGYYLDSSAITQMTTSNNSITRPTKDGYMFLGYYTEPNGGGTRYIDPNGKISNLASTTNFSSNGTLYAYWGEGRTITITANGSGNIKFLSDSYNDIMPDYVFIDGTSITPAKSYNFTSGGSHTIILKWNDSSSLITTASMFRDCSRLTSLDLSNLDTSQVINMSYMFSGCTSLTSLDISNFDTRYVTNMTYMFFNCFSLTSLDISNFNTRYVTSMYGMFRDCSSLTSLDLSNFDTSKVTDMDAMFRNCSSLTSLDLSSFNTRKVKYMDYMFNSCPSLTSLDLSNFDTSAAVYMSNMFDGHASGLQIKAPSSVCSKIASDSGISGSYTCHQ